MVTTAPSLDVADRRLQPADVASGRLRFAAVWARLGPLGEALQALRASAALTLERDTFARWVAFQVTPAPPLPDVTELADRLRDRYPWAAPSVPTIGTPFAACPWVAVHDPLRRPTPPPECWHRTVVLGALAVSVAHRRPRPLFRPVAEAARVHELLDTLTARVARPIRPARLALLAALLAGRRRDDLCVGVSLPLEPCDFFDPDDTLVLCQPDPARHEIWLDRVRRPVAFPLGRGDALPVDFATVLDWLRRVPRTRVVHDLRLRDGDRPVGRLVLHRRGPETVAALCGRAWSRLAAGTVLAADGLRRGEGMRLTATGGLLWSRTTVHFWGDILGLLPTVGALLAGGGRRVHADETAARGLRLLGTEPDVRLLAGDGWPACMASLAGDRGSRPWTLDVRTCDGGRIVWCRG